MIKRDITKLPKWVQKLLSEKETIIKRLEHQLKMAQLASQITTEWVDWYTVGQHTKEWRWLYLLNKDSATKVCSFGEDSILLVGRKRTEEEKEAKE